MDDRCEICDARKAVHTCIGCGKRVCSTCFWTQVGVCKACGDKGAGVLR